MTTLNGQDYWDLHDLFDGSYAGYRPNVAEIPNGDGKVDAEKRFLHIALKYNPPKYARRLLAIAHGAACEVAEAMGVPAYLRPCLGAGALRVLDYPAGAGSELHTDFDLFTVNLWRDPPLDMGARMIAGHSVHIGELGELIESHVRPHGLGLAQPHSVPALPTHQHSLVYFAIPEPTQLLVVDNHTVSVAEWLTERIARSRVYK